MLKIYVELPTVEPAKDGEAVTGTIDVLDVEFEVDKHW